MKDVNMIHSAYMVHGIVDLIKLCFWMHRNQYNSLYWFSAW